jgi:hypothetical protein
VIHILTSIDVELSAAIDPFGSWRDDFTNPIGGDVGPGRIGKERDAFSTPPGDVGYDDVITKMKLRLEKNPPTSGVVPAATRTVEAVGDFSAESRGRVSVRERRPGARKELSIQDLAHQMVGHCQEVRVSRWLSPS